ncbi:hypothetical protein AMAG_12091 [Allomyces macrogynus ATCC 38327]|uniref:Long-chain-fatty-acid--CoA ligase n=1 Tax=Allomyces macrogynus (strain ATCC 38327) TaxID=578462 RepID=A0A0L0SYQ2_ALLM3|nr:hypothetical protein AMAG_12091 [Allomyces macrogynus ATCC 38327]|eukprot:KNE67637.1 hypothetical protein AMAG_12091 [Allomyces macrogynus ATCC 38327]
MTSSSSSSKRSSRISWTPTSFTYEVPGAPEIPGEGKPRRAAYMEGLELLDMPPGVNSLHENFLLGVKIASDNPYLGHRIRNEDGSLGPYEWETYAQVYERVKKLGSGLAQLSIDHQEAVGLYSINRPEWVIAEQACYLHMLTTVPLYDTLGDAAIEYIVNQTEMRVCFATLDKAHNLIRLKPKLRTLLFVVIMDDPVPEEFVRSANRVGVRVIGMREMEEQGGKREMPAVRPGPDAVATICYTSGTTGVPKGAILTHRNILAVAYGVHYMGTVGRFHPITANDVHLSALPLSHCFERAWQQLLVMNGARIGFYSGDMAKLLDDAAELKPTMFNGVPRLFTRIYDKVWAQVRAKGGIAAYLFQRGYAAKKAYLAQGYVKHALWDKLVFGNVRAKLGGRVRFMLSGSAPISPEVMDFLKVAFSCDVYHGYGQTETAAGIAITFMGDFSSGHVGAPFGSGEVKLVDVPSLNYSSKDKPCPRGEILIRGNQVFKGYYKNPEKTAEALTSDGWVRTGDVAMWDENGKLVVIDRVKDIFKLAQGEYIAPEKIENVYLKHDLVAQAFVYGDSLQPALVGVIVPDEETFLPWAKAQGYEPSATMAELVQVPELKKKFLQLLVAHGKKYKLNGFEQVRAIYLEADPFTVENTLLTPTFKLRRPNAKEYYQVQINDMYAQLSA